MAATRLIALHENKGRTISRCLKDRTDYVKNGEKTNDGEYISSYECNPEIVDQEFYSSRQEYLREHRMGKRDVIAYQIRQSFKPGEVTPEEANAIGYELAMRFTKGDHAFIVATHTDRAHIHNHIIYNSVNLSSNRKFRDFFFSGLALQKVSDHICLEHGLSVIKPRGYDERSCRDSYPKRQSYRNTLCEIIDEVFKQKPKDMNDFYDCLRKRGIEIKYGKYPALKQKGQKKFLRMKSLGRGYTPEDIEEGLTGRTLQKVYMSLYASDKKVDMLVDIQAKLAEGKGEGYRRWAGTFNVKTMAKVLLFLQEHDVRDIDTLRKRADDATSRFNKLSEIIKGADKRMAEIKDLKMHIINYSRTKDIYTAYRESGYSRKFYEEYRIDIVTHKEAKAAFNALKGKKLPTIKELNREYGELLVSKNEAYRLYRKARQDMKDYVTAKYDVERFLNMQEQEIETEKVRNQPGKTNR